MVDAPTTAPPPAAQPPPGMAGGPPAAAPVPPPPPARANIMAQAGVPLQGGSPAKRPRIDAPPGMPVQRMPVQIPAAHLAPGIAGLASAAGASKISRERTKPGSKVNEIRAMAGDPTRFKRWSGKSWVAKCSIDGCFRQPGFGVIESGKKIPRFCKQHKRPGDLGMMHPMCETCNASCATFGNPEENKKRFCGAHRRPNDVDLFNAMCKQCALLVPPVRKRAIFGSGKDRKKQFCGTHRRPGDIDLVHPGTFTMCEQCQKEKPAEPQTWAAANWGALGIGEKKKFCNRHKRETDVDLSSPLCEGCLTLHPPVRTVATCGAPTTTGKMRFCVQHKGPNDVELKSWRQLRRAAAAAAAAGTNEIATERAGRQTAEAESARVSAALAIAHAKIKSLETELEAARAAAAAAVGAATMTAMPTFGGPR